MFIDFDIPIPPNTPKLILEDLEELQRLYDAGDWCYFDSNFAHQKRSTDLESTDFMPMKILPLCTFS